ncbi:DedA family protein [Bacillus sp. FJAT-50079]|uniref:DedA family protein n=1 Tax=Bacillus sp. FJAT-50079 TaxID=2833577 RepID=UPI001BC98457|nr:DedA family protein [Bacillus sp. FJAT-50079]MBS4210067.1 DedA family protein [Bacillus sp. FJAT-50079]
MIQQFLEWLSTIGLSGLFIAMFLEGSSLPFPGLAIVLSYGYLLSPEYVATIFIAAGMSVFYSLSSLIPYFIGEKLERIFPNKLRKKLDRGIHLFNRYGVWSIALTRPFGVGNYISYVAGMSKVNVYKYLLLTFIGIYPWSYVMILAGAYVNGNYEVFKNYFSTYSIYGYGMVLCGIAIAIFIYYRKSKQRNSNFTKWKKGGQSE